MPDGRNGQVVTFYSYKGGTGRTMALANVAWILAAGGRRVLAVDWDLESPGLHRFFGPFLDAGKLESTRGVIDMIREYEWATTREGGSLEFMAQYASVRRHAVSLDWRFPEGTLDYLSAGQQNHEYGGTLAEMDWDDFYQHQHGGRFFDAMRADMKRHYDYTLIDSRTGHSDIAAICTSHLPDVLVDCFTLSEQGIDGAAQMARQLRGTYARRNIRVLPVPMRVDQAEKRKADLGRAVAMRRFEGLPADLSEAERRRYWNGVQVPYQAYYGYEEILSTFADSPGLAGSLLNAYENLTRYITDGDVQALAPLDAGVRAQVVARFEREPLMDADLVVLSNVDADQVWAEWLEYVLAGAGLQLWDAPAPDEAPPVHAQFIRIVSRANAEAEQQRPDPDAGSGLVIYVADVTPLRRVAQARSTVVARLAPGAAVARVLELVGRTVKDVDSLLAGAPRFPGEEPAVINLPARNINFTGREAALRELRAQLRSGAGAAVVLFGAQSVALQGLGGVGKTQLALEYAYRYRAAYDVVFWLNADTAENLEGSLRDLGGELNLEPEQSGRDHARAVLSELGRNERRWLLIFDNADEPDFLAGYLPKGPGHVLITSRNRSWGDVAQAVQVEVFKREESIDHLLQRVTQITKEEAFRVAEQLADLPIAVAAAGAWLSETGTPVAEYLLQIQAEGPSAALAASSDASIARTWDLSLNRLRQRDPAAYRLFQLCSVLAPEIALDLIFSDQMAEYLRQHNPAVADRLMRGSLVQQINKLALLRLDQRPGQARGGQVLIHRVVQNVVRDRMTAPELEEARRQVHHVLAKARPEGEVDQQEHWPRYRILWPHLDLSGAIDSDDPQVRQLFIDRARYLWLQGDLTAGRDRAERTIQAWTERLARTTDPAQAVSLRTQLLHLRFNLANLLRDLGEFQRSRELDEEVLAEQAELLGERHAHTLMTAGGLAADLRGLGRYEEALRRDLVTHEAWRDEFGENNPRTLSAQNNLAVDHRLMGDFRRARDVDEEVLSKRREFLGERNLYTLASAACLARDIRDAGDYADSVTLLERTLRDLVDTRGVNARSTVTTRSNYAVSLRSAGALEEALRLHEEAYRLLNDLLGEDSPETLSCRLSLALSLLTSGHHDRATEELQILRTTYADKLGPGHPYALVCTNDMAIAERARGRIDIAVTLAHRAVEGLAGTLGAEHPYTLSAQLNLAICIADAGDATDGRRRIRQIMDPVRRVFGPEHPNTLRCAANIALMDRALGDGAAEVRLARLTERVVGRVGERHPITSALQRRRYLYRIIDPHQF